MVFKWTELLESTSLDGSPDIPFKSSIYVYQRKILYTTTKPFKKMFCLTHKYLAEGHGSCITSCGFMTPSSRHMQRNTNCVMSQQLAHYATLVRKKHPVKHTRMIHKSIWAIFTPSRKQKGENVLSKYDSCFIHSLAKGSVGGRSLGGDRCVLNNLLPLNKITLTQNSNSPQY